MKRYNVYTKEKGLVECDYIVDIAELTWHREDGPAITEYFSNGNIKCELYFINNTRSRFNGPTYIEYNSNGSVKHSEYWINNIWYTKEDYHKELLKLKVQSL